MTEGDVGGAQIVDRGVAGCNRGTRESSAVIGEMLPRPDREHAH